MQYFIDLGLALLPYVITIVVCIILRKVLIKVLGETHQINAYVLVIIPVMCVLLGFYTLMRPIFLGERNYSLPSGSPMHVASKGYTIDESWKKNGLADIKVGDIVVYRNGTKEAYSKQSVIPTLECARVIGLPGNRLVSVKTGTGNSYSIEIDGQKRGADLASTDFVGLNDLHYGLTVPDGSLWVMADSGRRMGLQNFDSPYVGPVRASQIVGVINAWGEKDFTDLVDDTKAK